MECLLVLNDFLLYKYIDIDIATKYEVFTR